MRRIVGIATAVLVLVAAGAAVAATSQINTYTAKTSYTSKKAGTAKKPVPYGFTTDLTASGTNGNRTAVLTDIKTTIFGLKMDGKHFGTCSLTQIDTAGNDTVCPKSAAVAKGYITAIIGLPNNFGPSGFLFNCDPLLDVWNAGQGKLSFFFVDQAPNHTCASLTTGSVNAYPGTYKNVGKNLVIDVPVPSYVSFPAGLAGSLVSEHLVWGHMTTKVHGKTYSVASSVACDKGSRPSSVKFTATLPPPSGTGASQTATVSTKGKGACKG